MPQGSKILVVEDEMIISMEIKQKLHAMGYVVTGQAITGESAIQKAGETQPDIVLMDIRLKGDMDGITAAKRIIELYDLPIIFLTAHSDKATLERAIAVSPSGYLLKPFKERELMTNIEMSLHKHRVRLKLKEEVSPLSSPAISKDLASSPVAVLTTSISGQIEYVNPAVEGLTGYGEKELIKKPLLSFIEEQEHARDADSRAAPVRPHPLMPDQVGLRRRDGTIIPVTISLGLITGGTDEEKRNLFMISGIDVNETSDMHLGPAMIQYLMRITQVLRLPAFVLDRKMMLAGYNQLFTDIARRAGISQYMFTRPMFETQNFQMFADMQDLQELFRSGDLDSKIKKFKTGEEISFMQFTRIPIKRDDVTTHIATVMFDVTSEKKAVYEAEKIKKVFSDLFFALEKLRKISSEMKIPLQEMIRKTYEDQKGTGEPGSECGERLLSLLTELEISWIQYSEIRDAMK